MNRLSQRAPRWGDAQAAARRLGPREVRLVRLLARLPLAPMDVLAAFFGPGSPSRAYRAGAALARAGLMAWLRPPRWPLHHIHEGPAPRLLYLTDLGVAVAIVCGESPRSVVAPAACSGRCEALAGTDADTVFDVDVDVEHVFGALVRERRLSAAALLSRLPGAARLEAEYRLLGAL